MVAMTYRGRRRLLWTVNVALGALSAACVAFALAAPLEVGVPEAPEAKAASSAEAAKDAAPEPLLSYAVIYQRDLRKPLFPPTVVETPRPAPAKPALGVQLLGTAVDPGHTYGFFRDRTGETKIISVGETVDGAEVTAITDGAATVKYHGEVLTLRVPAEGGEEKK